MRLRHWSLFIHHRYLVQLNNIDSSTLMWTLDLKIDQDFLPHHQCGNVRLAKEIRKFLLELSVYCCTSSEQVSTSSKQVSQHYRNIFSRLSRRSSLRFMLIVKITLLSKNGARLSDNIIKFSLRSQVVQCALKFKNKEVTDRNIETKQTWNSRP